MIYKWYEVYKDDIEFKTQNKQKTKKTHKDGKTISKRICRQYINQ